ncbi:hypothetical protein AX16_010505 [Volvariella volvacea WC 439]|nr:hypothetical protein AX16_010505 [Volvariella volvacea WC 439]
MVSTTNYGIKYNGLDETPLHCYSDSDHTGDLTDRKSTSRFVFYLAGAPITWQSRKQETVAHSSTEAGYIALAEALKQANWYHNIFSELKIPLAAIEILGDNKGSVDLAMTYSVGKHSKHINIKHHFIKEVVEHGIASVTQIPTGDNVADICTKSLASPLFDKFVAHLSFMMVG